MLKLKIQKTVGTFQFKLRFPNGRIRAITNRLRPLSFIEVIISKNVESVYASTIVRLPTDNRLSHMEA